MTRSADTIAFGVCGMGGYAQMVANTMLSSGPLVDPPVRLHAVCDPHPERFAERVDQLENEQVGVFDDFEALLAEPIEAVWLPVPIHLHQPFTVQALEAGKAVMCEKPAAGTIDEVDAMIAARDRTGLPVAIGFQDIYNTMTLALKRRLLAGEFGRVTATTVVALWPRDTNYYERNAWAGRLKIDDSWVLDSPVNNAMAHFIALPLFLLGPTPDEAAQPVAIEAELYRAAQIENYDTASLSVDLDTGSKLNVYYTHASRGQSGPIITIHTDRGRVIWNPTSIVAELDTGTEVIERDPDRHTVMLQRFARAVRGIDDQDSALVTLEIARAHALVVSGASQAAAVQPVPSEAIEPTVSSKGGKVTAIVGIEEALNDAAERRIMLHETGRLAFSTPPASLDLRNYRHFEGVPAASCTPEA